MLIFMQNLMFNFPKNNHMENLNNTGVVVPETQTTQDVPASQNTGDTKGAVSSVAPNFSFKPLPTSVAELIATGSEVPVSKLPVARTGEYVYPPVATLLSVTNVKVGNRTVDGDDRPLLVIEVKELEAPLFLTLKQVKNMLPDVVAQGDSLATARRNISYFCTTLRAKISLHNEGAIAPSNNEGETAQTCTKAGVWLDSLAGVFTREEKRELFLFQTEQEARQTTANMAVGVSI